MSWQCVYFNSNLDATLGLWNLTKKERERERVKPENCAIRHQMSRYFSEERKLSKLNTTYFTKSEMCIYAI